MSSHSSTTERRARRRIAGEESGSTMIAFAVVIPVLMTLTMGTLELALIAFDYFRASEAVRAAARQAAMAGPIADMTEVENGNIVTCTFTTVIYCDGEGVTDGQVFNDLVASVQQILPTVTASNLTVRYEPSGLGDPDTPGGIIPLLNVSITGLQHEFIVMGFIEGISGGITLPRVEATTVSNSVEGGS